MLTCTRLIRQSTVVRQQHASTAGHMQLACTTTNTQLRCALHTARTPLLHKSNRRDRVIPMGAAPIVRTPIHSTADDVGPSISIDRSGLMGMRGEETTEEDADLSGKSEVTPMVNELKAQIKVRTHSTQRNATQRSADDTIVERRNESRLLTPPPSCAAVYCFSGARSSQRLGLHVSVPAESTIRLLH